MFDFTPVGLVVALAGLAFLVLASRRLIVSRDVSFAEPEAAVREPARARARRRPGTRPGARPGRRRHRGGPRRGAGSPRERPARGALQPPRVRVPGRVAAGWARRWGTWSTGARTRSPSWRSLRRDRRRLAPHLARAAAGRRDVLILEGESEALQPLFVDPHARRGRRRGDRPRDAEVPGRARDRGRRDAELGARGGLGARGFGIHPPLRGEPAGARARGPRGARPVEARALPGRRRAAAPRARNAALEHACSSIGCLAIKDRGLDIVRRRGALAIPSLFAGGILAAAVGLVPIQIAFTTVVGLLVLGKLISRCATPTAASSGR